jgi:hypothetical protein
MQDLSLDEDAAVPTCNLSETVHNTWKQASDSISSDLYNATLDDYCRAALQSTAYHNYLKGGGGGTGPDRSVLRLRSASRSGDPRKIAQAVGELFANAGLNSRVPHLEGESIFGSAKRKLDLPPGDESDSHRHDRVNFTLPKISRMVTPGQMRRRRCLSESAVDPVPPIAFTKSGLMVSESECDPMAWRIERIDPSSTVTCRGHFNGKRCTAKIAKYRRATVAPTFTGIERVYKSDSTQQKQFWFCPSDVSKCVLAHSKWIIHYPDIPHTWPVKSGTSLTQAEVEDLEAAGFNIDEGDEFFDKLDARVEALQSNSAPQARPPKGSGDSRPTMRDNKAFRFVADPSPDHFSKMAKSIDIDCTVVKFLKVPAPGYGIVYTVHTPGSVAKQQLYEVTISDFPTCKCLDFISMKSYALGNRKKKWIYCKHIYFILQRCMGCTKEDKFIHCPAYTFNEVILLLDRADALSSID